MKSEINLEKIEALERILSRHPEIGEVEVERRHAFKVIQQPTPIPFAVVKVSGDYLMPASIEATVQDYYDLSCLFPVVLVHGSGEQISDKLGYTRKHRGIRVTPPSELPDILEVSTELTFDLVKLLTLKGAKALPVVSTPSDPIFYFDRLESFRDPNGERIYLGEVGIAPLGKEARCIREGYVAELVEIMRLGYMPVVSPVVHSSLPSRLAINAPHHPLNPDADDIARVLARTLNLHYIIFVTENAENLNIDLSTVLQYLETRVPEGIRDAFPQDHYRDAQWKVAAALELALNKINVAIVSQENLFPFLLSSKPEQYSAAFLTQGMIESSETLSKLIRKKDGQILL